MNANSATLYICNRQKKSKKSGQIGIRIGQRNVHVARLERGSSSMKAMMNKYSNPSEQLE